MTAVSNMTVGRMLTNRSRSTPNGLAVSDVNGPVTFAALEERANQLAAGLLAIGLEPGDRIGVLLENRLEYVELLYGSAKAGVAAALLSWRSVASELAAAIDVAALRVCFVSERHRELYESAMVLRSRPEPIETVWLGEGSRNGGPVYEQIRGDASTIPVDVDAELPLLLINTSGTTGPPKAAAISHRALIARGSIWAAEQPLHPDDAFICWSPMFHTVASEFVFHTHCHGGPIIIIDGFQPEAMITALTEHTVCWFVLLPGTMERFADEVRRRQPNIRGVRGVGTLPDLVPGSVRADISSALGAPFMNSFGSTETGLISGASRIPIGHAGTDVAKEMSVFANIRLLDPDGREVGVDEPGEICLRGTTLFNGYFGDADANAAAFVDGWFHMGDMARFRPDGLLEWEGRCKYMIKSGGENIYPAELERVLLSFPGVAEAIVVRAPDPKWGEVPFAFVGITDEALESSTLLAYCEGKISRFKMPRQIELLRLEDLPRNVTGKVVRDELEARALRSMA